MKPIFAALDESERAPKVLSVAIRLALTFDAPLVLFRSVALPAVALSPDGLPTPFDYQADAEKHAREALTALAKKVPQGVKVRVVTAVDIPWQGVCETAKQENASLIVIGSHGYAGLDRLLGTTAAKVVNHADRSVLVVRGDWPAA